jgi:hypothetical protein
MLCTCASVNVTKVLAPGVSSINCESLLGADHTHFGSGPCSPTDRIGPEALRFWRRSSLSPYAQRDEPSGGPCPLTSRLECAVSSPVTPSVSAAAVLPVLLVLPSVLLSVPAVLSAAGGCASGADHSVGLKKLSIWYTCPIVPKSPSSVCIHSSAIAPKFGSRESIQPVPLPPPPPCEMLLLGSSAAKGQGTFPWKPGSW